MTGKSTLIRETIPEALVVNLLNNDFYFSLLEKSFSLENVVSANTDIVVIDEIQIRLSKRKRVYSFRTRGSIASRKASPM